jgi:hypothetical protein
VSNLSRRGDQLTAEVEGSEFEPYQVSIRLHDGDARMRRALAPTAAVNIANILSGTSNNDDFFVGSIAGAVGR